LSSKLKRVGGSTIVFVVGIFILIEKDFIIVKEFLTFKKLSFNDSHVHFIENYMIKFTTKNLFKSFHRKKYNSFYEELFKFLSISKKINFKK